MEDDSNVIRYVGELMRSLLSNYPILDAGRAVSVYNSGKGFIIKIHDQLGLKFRCSHYNGAGTLAGDTLCMDANDAKIVVAGHNSQKVLYALLSSESPCTNQSLVSV